MVIFFLVCFLLILIENKKENFVLITASFEITIMSYM